MATPRRATRKKTTPKKTTKRAAEPTPHKKAVPFWERPATQWVLSAFIAAAIVVIIVLAVLWVRANQEPQNVLALVNGEPIYVDEVRESYERLPLQFRAIYTPELVLNQTIDKMLVLQHARNNGITVTDEEVAASVEEQAALIGMSVEDLRILLETQNITWEELETAIREEIIIDRLVEEFIEPRATVSDSDIFQFYAENPQRFSAAEGQVRIKHILVETEDEAWDILAEALSGTSFSSLARTHSLDSTAADGGNLGFVDEDTQFVPEFLDVALQLDTDEISDPVETQFGWHLIMRDTDDIPLSEVRDQIRRELEDTRSREEFFSLLETLRREGDIRILQDINTIEGFEPVELDDTPFIIG